MDLFIDTANVDEIREINGWGILSGVTTNPTLAAKEGKQLIVWFESPDRRVHRRRSLERVLLER